MSCNKNCESDSKNYDPYMLGGSYSLGAQQSASCSGGVNLCECPETVDNCMNWCEIGKDPRGGNGCWSYGSPVTARGSRSMAAYPVVAPMKKNHGNWGRPRAFVSNGNGNTGQRERVSIPCQMAPLGTDPRSLIIPMEPLTLRVKAPAACNGGPMTFTLDPNEIYGSMFKKC